ncbi:MAG: NADH-quinone oxidoreductase subunit N [Acidobacteria bacterium]|nr:NADH-quinone oxidoreductase subunit N [Acidobacteriota bacterium]
MPTHSDLLALLPELVLTLSAALLLLFEAFLPSLKRYASELSLLAIVGAAWARLTLPLPGASWNGMLQIDAVASFVDLYILAAMFLTIWMAGPFLRRNHAEHSEFYALLMLAAVGAMIMACSTDLLPLFLGLELLSIPLYVLNAFFRRVPVSLEAGLKYFIVGAFAAAFMAYGIALLYGATGTTDLVNMGRVLSAAGGISPWVAVGLSMVIGALAFKLAIFPFHGWAPDVYQGGPTPVTAFLSVVPKGAALVVLLRLAQGLDLLRLDSHWVWAAGIMAVASQTLGNIVAIVQRDIKRMLAYSGIAHMGYALVGVIVAGTDGSSAVLFYLAAYTFMNIGAFAVVALLSEGESEAHVISDLAGQGWKRPVLSLALTVCMFSLAGVPPFVGFAAKFLVFRAAVNQGLIWLAIFGVLNSLISAFYYLRVVYVLYMRPLPKREPAYPRSRTITAVAAVAALAVVVVGILPTPLLAAARSAAGMLVR